MASYMMQSQTKVAKAIGHDLPVSPKVAMEICAFLRGKELERSIRILERVQKKEEAIPYRKFNHNIGHRPGMAAGRYPIKASGEILKLLRNAKANAQNQGMSGTLTVVHIAANKAAEPMRNRSKHRGSFKRAHIELMLRETPMKTAKKASAKKAVKQAEKHVESHAHKHAEVNE